MMIFDFLKKLLGFADQGSRKRRADDSSNSYEESVQAKRLCLDSEMGHHQPACTDPRLCDDVDDIEVIPVENHRPAFTNKLPNGKHDGQMKNFPLPNSGTFLSPVNTPQHARRCDLNAGCFAGKSNTSSCASMGSKYSTLAKTHRLREKKQYGEMLQNFVPHRIQILNDKSDEIRITKPTAEVIDLEEYESSNSLQKVEDITRTPSFLSNSRWYMPAKTTKNKASVNRSRNYIPGKSFASSSSIKTMKDGPGPSTVPQYVPLMRVPVNSLRDKFAARDVIKNDFIPQVAKRYNVRIDQRSKEAEELKRRADLISKRNRLEREAGLEEQLSRTMRLCLAVLDETEEEEEPPLPVLTPEMLQVVKSALVPRPPNQILVESFGLRITRKDIHTLSDLNWLNDEVINFYMNLLIVRGTSGNFPKVHAMNTFFYPKLLSGGHTSLKRWTRKIDIFAQDLLVIPVHLGIHWCMSIVDFRDKSIRYYDSMGGKNPKCLSALRQYMQDESMDKKKKPFDMNDWKLECARNIPQQMNGSDCGVFSCMFAEYISGNKKITFTQEDMPYFRHKMVYEILKSKLL